MENTLPFDLPLKGKGYTRKLIRAAERSITEIEQQMLELSDEFRDVFRGAPSLGLVRQRAGDRTYCRLLWRLYKSSWGVQKYITLFATAEGRRVLGRLSPAVRSVVMQLEPRRLDLNARMVMAMAQYRSCNDYLTALEVLELFRAAAGTAPDRRTRWTA